MGEGLTIFDGSIREGAAWAAIGERGKKGKWKFFEFDKVTWNGRTIG